MRRPNATTVSAADFRHAVDRVTSGTERPSRVLSDAERQVTLDSGLLPMPDDTAIRAAAARAH
jgi:hypothetical protein